MRSAYSVGKVQLQILREAKQKGRITKDRIKELYSQRGTAYKGIKSLRKKGYLEYVGLDEFVVDDLPEWIEEKLEES